MYSVDKLNKLMSVFHAFVLLLIMIMIKVAVDPRGDSRVDPQTTLTKFIVNNRTDA